MGSAERGTSYKVTLNPGYRRSIALIHWSMEKAVQCNTKAKKRRGALQKWEGWTESWDSKAGWLSGPSPWHCPWGFCLWRPQRTQLPRDLVVGLLFQCLRCFITLIRTSWAFGGATSTSSIERGFPASQATAALHLITCNGKTEQDVYPPELITAT